MKAQVLEELIPLIDNFEAAKQFIKVRRAAGGGRARAPVCGSPGSRSRLQTPDEDFCDGDFRELGSSGAACVSPRGLSPRRLRPCPRCPQPETDGEKKIENSYQGLYKQMVDLFKKMGIEAVRSSRCRRALSRSLSAAAAPTARAGPQREARAGRAGHAAAGPTCSQDAETVVGWLAQLRPGRCKRLGSRSTRRSTRPSCGSRRRT